MLVFLLSILLISSYAQNMPLEEKKRALIFAMRDSSFPLSLDKKLLETAELKTKASYFKAIAAIPGQIIPFIFFNQDFTTEQLSFEFKAANRQPYRLSCTLYSTLKHPTYGVNHIYKIEAKNCYLKNLKSQKVSKLEAPLRYSWSKNNRYNKNVDDSSRGHSKPLLIDSHYTPQRNSENQ